MPVLQTDRYLDFYSYHTQGLLTKNCFGIKEPEIIKENVILPGDLDLIFLPLVAFDKDGNRLGRGSGYYDHTFAFLKTQSIKKPLLVGIAYEFQKIDKIPTDEWDVHLDLVVTEKNIYQF